MRVALSVSSVLHAGIIAWGLIALPDIDPYESTPQPSLPVDLVSITEFTQITAGTRDGDKEIPPAPPEPVEEAKPADQPKPEPKPDVATAPAPEPEPEPVELRTASLPEDEPDIATLPAAEPDEPDEPDEAAEVAPEPTPTPLPDNAPLPKSKPKVAARPKPAPTAEPRKQESEFDADRIAALLNKVPDSGGGAPSDAGTLDPSFGTSSGTEAALSISEIDALRAQIARCWNPPVGVLEAGQLLVRIGMELNPDGTLAAPPMLLNGSPDPIFTVAAEAAIRAVNACQPYYLPPEKFSAWQQIHMTFDPRELLGG